jgi:hypothetical protein
MEVDRLAIHRDVASVVDRILRGENARPEIRLREPDGEIRVVQETLAPGRPAGRGDSASINYGSRAGRGRDRGPREASYTPSYGGSGLGAGAGAPVSPVGGQTEYHFFGEGRSPQSPAGAGDHGNGESPLVSTPALRPVRSTRRGTVNIFPYGVSRSRLERAIHELGVPANISRDIRDAHALLTLKSHLKEQAGNLKGAENLPVFVIKSNTYVQIANALRDIFQMDSQDVEERAMQEAEDAIEQVMAASQPVELLPQSAYIRRLQHQLVERYKLSSESVGHEPNRRLRIFKGALQPAGEV